jgi:amino acid adenylation domain-containing protein
MAIGQNQGPSSDVRIDGLSDAKRRLLEQRLRGEPAQAPADQVVPRPADAKVPLSAEQRRVWLHASQGPDLAIYNEPFTVRRYGSFNLKVLEASLNEILRRHEAWRTSFSAQGEEVIHPFVRVTLPFLDLSGLPEARRESEALRLATEDAQNPIPLESVPLFRARVVRIKPDEHRLYLTFHHIVFDGVSIARIFMPEFTAIYAAFEKGDPSPLPEPALQYADYSLWRERHLASPAVRQRLAYWLEHLSGDLPVLHLPEDRPRPAVASHRGSMETFEFPYDLVKDLRELSSAQGVTLYITLLAVFNVLLFRYSAQNDLIIGSVTDARRRPELESVMGYFLDTFAIRTRPAADLRFSEYLSQTRDSVLGGLAAAEVPFDRVVHEVNPKRNTSHHPIFQAFFSIRPPMPRIAEGWNLTQMDVTVGTTKFMLHLELGERPDFRPDRIEARFLYNTDIWDAATIKRMSAHWLALLRSVCQDPENTLGALSLLTPEETARLVGPGGWNDTGRPFPQATLTSLFEDQVRRSPNATAAVFGNQSWTYADLNSRVNTLADSLLAAGVTRGSIVAIILDRSLDLLAGLLAILKTGAAYLPIDVLTPSERIRLCLADAQPAAILTHSSLLEKLPTADCTNVLVDQVVEQGSLRPTISPDAKKQQPSQLDDTAYLIYTSGTTGEPKAVEISQRSLVNLLTSMQAAPGFGREDILLSVTPISFDIGALEMFMPIISGGTVVIASRDEAHDPQLLQAVMRQSRCTVMQATPSAWRALLLAGWNSARLSAPQSSPRTLKVLCGGEAMPRELANRLLATGAELWNMYGPTETTVWSLIDRVQPAPGSIPISVGHPIANTQAHVLDQQLQPLPVGVQGELFIGGAGLAIGYRGKPEQTAARFLSIASLGDARLYRTGDVAVRRVDGSIEILGRTDNQVKVRGYRVELEAVEAAVLRHPQVAAAAARAWPDYTGDFRLSAYVVGKDGPPPSPAEIRAFLKKSLPDGMIPSDVIALSTIPLTPHGKVDRAKLPAPNAAENAPSRSSSRNAGEERVSAIWAELLKTSNAGIGLDDDFFDLGGHSLLVAALQQRIAAEFGQQIPIAELFQSPTVRKQAELIQNREQGKAVLPPGVLALQPYGSRNSFFWIQSAGVNLAKAIGEDQPLLYVALTAEDFGPLGPEPDLQSIAACLLRKIRTAQPKGPYAIGGLCVGGILAYEVAYQARTAGEEVSLLVMLDAPNPARLQFCSTLKLKLEYLGYALKRGAHKGLQISFSYTREHIEKFFERKTGNKPEGTEMRSAQQISEAAAFKYVPPKYDSKVLLLQASERPPHKDFVPGWQCVVTGELHAQPVDAHHRDLLQAGNVQSIADAIVGHLESGPNGHSRSCCARVEEECVVVHTETAQSALG